MRHFVNESPTVVHSAIDALVRSSGGRLARLDGYPDIKVVRRVEIPAGQVALISGGGAGHEPAHAGFVGAGLLSAAVSGEIFASPSVEAVLAACSSVDAGAGCLLIVKNYTGDRLNFGLALERARSAGLQVEMVVVSDDIALADVSQPRGIAGTLFVHKIAGAAAQSGATLQEVSELARHVADRVRTLGVSMSGADIPGRAPARAFDEGTVELGLGIHGEPGVETLELGLVAALVHQMAARLQEALPAEGPLALMVNDLGGLSGLELGVVLDDLLDTPIGRRAELLVGPAPLMTSISMRGFSFSALPLDASTREALLAPSEPLAAWPPVQAVGPVELIPLPATDRGSSAPPSKDPAARAVIAAVCAALVAQRERLDGLDAQVGDGDTGSAFAAAATRIDAELDTLPLADHPALLHRLAELMSVSMGGSSGVLLSIMLTAAASSPQQQTDLAVALLEGAQAMQRYGGASLGDRTMLDALLPALEQLSAGAGIAAAAAAAADGAASTAETDQTTAGRSAYVPASKLRGVRDPGAEAVAVAFAAAAATLG